MKQNRNDLIVRSFLVDTSKRDPVRYPSSSDFTYELPVTLTNVVGIAIRDYKYFPETLINNNNRAITVIIDGTTRTVTIANGAYSSNINTLITELNSAFASHNIGFSVNGSNMVVISFTGSAIGSYLTIPPSPILRILGFPQGIVLYRSANAPATFPTGYAKYANSGVASSPYDVWTVSDIVLRITDVETIMSNDPVTNRCTSVLFTEQTNQVSSQKLDHYTPLLQMQHRLQSLRIKLLNTDGDLYDTVYNPALFLIEFYCVEKDNVCTSISALLP